MATAATTALVEALAPEFAGDSRITAFLSYAAAQMDEDTWDTLYAQGQAYLTAHLMKRTAAATSGAVGPITSRRALQLAESYGVIATSAEDAALATTVYGVEYLRLRGLLGGVGAFVSRIYP